MKLFIKNFLGIVFIILIIIACGRKTTPSASVKSDKSDSEKAVFNFYYVEAIKQKLMGNFGDALKYFEQCIKVNPKSDAAYYQIAQILSNNGDFVNAKMYLLNALKIDERNYWYLMMISGFYYQEKNLDSTIIYYEKAIKYYPDKDNLLLNLGNLYSENKNYDKAISIFNNIDERYGVNESSSVAIIKTLIAAKKYDEALSKTLTIVQNFPDEILYNGLLAEIYTMKGDKNKALETYNSMIQKNPANAQVQISVCGFLISQKMYSDLFNLLNTVIINPDVKKEDKISLIAQLIETPEILNENADNMLLSIMVLEANYKEDNIIQLLRPDFLFKKSRFAEAEARLTEIITKKPENYYAWEKLLVVYLQTGNYSMLIKRGEECATLFNMSLPAKLLYANGAIECGKYDIALEELRKAEILAGVDKENLMQVLTMRADVYYRKKDYTQAFGTFDKALAMNNQDLTLLNNYAYYLSEQGLRLKEAEEMSRRVVEKEKDNITYLDTYAWVLYKRGKISEAMKVMEKIFTSGEKIDATLYEHYGFILREDKKCSKAIEYWQNAIRLDSTKSCLYKEIDNCKK